MVLDCVVFVFKIISNNPSTHPDDLATLAVAGHKISDNPLVSNGMITITNPSFYDDMLKANRGLPNEYVSNARISQLASSSTDVPLLRTVWSKLEDPNSASIYGGEYINAFRQSVASNPIIPTHWQHELADKHPESHYHLAINSNLDQGVKNKILDSAVSGKHYPVLVRLSQNNIPHSDEEIDKILASIEKINKPNMRSLVLSGLARNDKLTHDQLNKLFHHSYDKTAEGLSANKNIPPKISDFIIRNMERYGAHQPVFNNLVQNPGVPLEHKERLADYIEDPANSNMFPSSLRRHLLRILYK